MPVATDSNKVSWAEQVEQGDDVLPPPLEDFEEKNGIKKITEFKLNDDGKKVKVVKTFKVSTIKVSKSIARRKAWKKFGGASGDPPGPNPTNTVISEDILLQFVHNKEGPQPDEEKDPLKNMLKGQKLVTCRYCKGDHWSKQCPHKDKLEQLQDTLNDKKPEGATLGAGPGAGAAGKTGKYVPPSLRGEGRGKGESMATNRRDESATIRVTNLSEDTRESDLQELFRPFGAIQRIYLAKDKNTGQSKGFAFINFHRREDAARAITGVSGFGYDHLILIVEWAKPSGTS